MRKWIEVAALDAIPRLGARVIKTRTMDIAVFRTAGDQVLAPKDACPHRQGPLSQGIVHDNTVTCPLHNWKIDLASGEAQGLDQGCAHRFPAKVENGLVYLGVTEEKAAA